MQNKQKEVLSISLMWKLSSPSEKSADNTVNNLLILLNSFTLGVYLNLTPNLQFLLGSVKSVLLDSLGHYKKVQNYILIT